MIHKRGQRAHEYESLKGTEMAYAAVIEGPKEGREVAGAYLAIAVKDEPGYHQLKPGFGPYENYEAAREHAKELNSNLGHDEKSALIVITSTMRRRP